MGYLRGYTWDVFVSYAHADDAGGAARILQDAILTEASKTLNGKLDVFFDQRKAKAYQSIDALMGQVQKSAILLIIGSPNWIKSQEYCLKELDGFLKHRADPTRVMVAEFEPPKGE